MRTVQFAEQPDGWPLFESVAAGFPSPASDFEEKQISLDQYCIQNPSATFFVKVDGDSMTGAGIFPGDIVVVDRSLRARIGDIVVAWVIDGYVVKRLERQGKLIYLASANLQYPPIIIEEGTQFEVWGVVTSVVHRLRDKGGK